MVQESAVPVCVDTQEIALDDKITGFGVNTTKYKKCIDETKFLVV